MFFALIFILTSFINSASLLRNKIDIPVNYQQAEEAKMVIGIEKSEPKVLFKSTNLLTADEGDKEEKEYPSTVFSNTWGIIFCAPKEEETGYRGTKLNTGAFSFFKNFKQCGIGSSLKKFKIPVNDLEFSDVASKDNNTKTVIIAAKKFKLFIPVSTSLATTLIQMKTESQNLIKKQIQFYYEKYQNEIVKYEDHDHQNKKSKKEMQSDYVFNLVNHFIRDFRFSVDLSVLRTVITNEIRLNLDKNINVADKIFRSYEIEGKANNKQK